MPSKNQTVMKVNKSTLEKIRKIAEIEQSTPPKIVDTAIEVLCYEYPELFEVGQADAKPS